jgi:low temperature requirement protein LtrA
MPSTRRSSWMRDRDRAETKVTYVELFFDLIYAFAVTQLSHKLLHGLSWAGALETLILWFAVWLGWQYTCWVTNWFDPDRIAVRLLLLALMTVGIVMAASLPRAFGDRAWIFGATYVAIQLGRTLAVLRLLGGGHALSANFRRIGGWLEISGTWWIAGCAAQGTTRLVLWLIAVGCEYVSPMFGFALPGLGRSRSADWRSAAGGHIAERCQGFVILALGESVVVTGATLSDTAQWSAPTLTGFLLCFVGSCAMWWIYFDTGSRAGSEAIERSGEPGMMAAYFHYVHVILVGGIIAWAAADDFVIEQPARMLTAGTAALLLGGPALYIGGTALYKRAFYGHLPLSHSVGLALLLALAPFAPYATLLHGALATVAVLVLTAAWEGRARRRPPRHTAAAPGAGTAE